MVLEIVSTKYEFYDYASIIYIYEDVQFMVYISKI